MASGPRASGSDGSWRPSRFLTATTGGCSDNSWLIRQAASDTRVRFDSLIADNDVHHIYYADGLKYENEQPSLSVGWARTLLENGGYTNPDGLVINLASGAWGNAGNAKMGFNTTHNDHSHVS